MKDQFIIACLESPATAGIVLPYAKHFASHLRKGIILLNVSRDGQSDWLKQYGLPYVGLKGDWKTAIDGLPTAFGGVLAVTAVDPSAPRSSITHPSTLLRTFSDCKIAYLLVNEEGGMRNEELGTGAINSSFLTPHSSFSTVLTLDHRRESKEKLIWGSYMVRFFGAKLTVATPAYNDAGLREKVANNILFMKKIYKSLNVDYTLSSFTYHLSPFTSPDLSVLKSDPSLLIAMTTDRRDRDLGDLLVGPPERRLITSARIPILFLNQRDDLYVLCD